MPNMRHEIREKCINFQGHFSELFKVSCNTVDLSENATPVLMHREDERFFCADCPNGERDELATRLYGCNEAHRWNGKYIYYCPMGLVFIATSIVDDFGTLMGGIVLGPMVMGDVMDVLSDLPVPGMKDAIMDMVAYSPQDVYRISEILSSVVSEISGGTNQKISDLMYDQERILKEIYIAKDYYEDPAAQNANSLLQFEKNLRIAVLRGERQAALQMLNEFLAHVYVYSNYDVNAIKARMLELLVTLSRATIEAGANSNEVFRLSEGYIRQIETYTDVDQLAFWVSDIVRRFIIQAFDLTKVKHSDVVFKITNFIKKNCGEKLSLDALAREVYLSKSYLSSMFKQETGVSLTEYITKVRIEKSKKMLLEDGVSLLTISEQCGFKDQSYFTKVFKKEVGVSPKKYRNYYFELT